MSDQTAGALQALIKQVETLTNTVTVQQERMDGLHEHNSRLLDQIKDEKRVKPLAKKSIVDVVDEQEHERKMRAANFEKDANGDWYLKGHRPKHAISRADARDPVKYRNAKAAAVKDGALLSVIDESDDDPTIRNTGQPAVIQSKTFTFDDTHDRIRYIRADMHSGSGIVHRQLAAEREGLKVRTFRTPDDLPQHARTKFELMERAANANSGEA